jgi:hypothetical protein
MSKGAKEVRLDPSKRPSWFLGGASHHHDESGYILKANKIQISYTAPIGVLAILLIVLTVLALKLPVVGLISFIYWAMKEPETEGPSEHQLRAMPLPLPEPDVATSRHRSETHDAPRPHPYAEELTEGSSSPTR